MELLPSTGNLKFDRIIKKLFKWFFGIASALAVLLFILHITRIGLTYWLYGAIAQWVATNLGFDYYLSQFIAIVSATCFTLAIPYVIWFLLLGRKKWIATLSIIAVTGTITLLMYTVGEKVYFDRATGVPLRYYVDTPEGRKFSFTKGFDPKYGIGFKPYTREIALGKNNIPKGDQLKSEIIFDDRWIFTIENLIGQKTQSIKLLNLNNLNGIGGVYYTLTVSVCNMENHDKDYIRGRIIYTDEKEIESTIWNYELKNMSGFECKRLEISSRNGDLKEITQNGTFMVRGEGTNATHSYSKLEFK